MIIELSSAITCYNQSSCLCAIVMQNSPSHYIQGWVFHLATIRTTENENIHTMHDFVQFDLVVKHSISFYHIDKIGACTIYCYEGAKCLLTDIISQEDYYRKKINNIFSTSS